MKRSTLLGLAMVFNLPGRNYVFDVGDSAIGRGVEPVDMTAVEPITLYAEMSEPGCAEAKGIPNPWVPRARGGRVQRSDWVCQLIESNVDDRQGCRFGYGRLLIGCQRGRGPYNRPLTPAGKIKFDARVMLENWPKQADPPPRADKYELMATWAPLIGDHR